MKRGTQRFTADDQLRFARFSGDVNPVHIDPISARRVAAGEPIVHGMHLLLRALESAAPNNTKRVTSSMRITARFLRPVLLDETIDVEPLEPDRIALTLPGGDTLVDIVVNRAKADAAGDDAVAADRARIRVARAPRVRTLADMASASGAVPLPARASATKMFRRAARRFGANVVAALAAVSRVVGMECPGRDSLLSAIDVRIVPHARATPLSWRVTRVDARFGLVRLAIDAGSVRGTVDAFVRPQPARVPSLAAATARVAEGEFARQRALIIGGSRGLGAATTLIVAAGGGAALVTYARGRADAMALRKAAAASGATMAVAHYDVIADPPATLSAICAWFKPTHLYYFATPRIFSKRREAFDDALFRTFAEFYVSGFARVCAAARTGSPALSVLYPSSVAVDEASSELMEYAAAKSAGERLGRFLDRPDQGLRVTIARLPRIATDQTASLISAPALDPIDAMLPVVRDMQR